MTDISVLGGKIRLIFSQSFPVGFDVTQFSDDQDPFDFPDLTIAESAMGVNGNLVTYSVANPVELNIAVIPDWTGDARNLAIAFDNNRPGANKLAVRDVVTAIITTADNLIVSLINGKMMSGVSLPSGQSSGRYKTLSFKFHFENYTRVL